MLVLTLVSGLIGVIVVPLLLFLVELPASALHALFTRRRLVVATHAGVAPSRLTWRTDVAHAAAVAEQVATQLRLGYERVEPHRAVFLGFSRPGGDGGD